MNAKGVKKIGMFFILLGLLSCSDNAKIDYNKIFEDNSNTFQHNKIKLKHIIDDLEAFHIKKWDRQKKLVIQLGSLSKPIQQDIKDIGIDGIVINKNPDDSCDVNYSISMNINKNWNVETLKFVQLRFEPCSKFTAKEYHFTDGYHVDFWGQGDNWYIASDTDWL